MSSLGEVIGAKLYISESIKPPMSYTMLQIVTIGAILGVVLQSSSVRL